MYAVADATDFCAKTGDAAHWKTVETLWYDLVDPKMYLTDGVGARADGEMVGDAYEPNADANSESCAAIGNIMWHWCLLAVSGSARFTDALEQALYNTVNSGISLSGASYCYRNPLEFKDAGIQNLDNRRLRNSWCRTTCCPPNLERAIASESLRSALGHSCST